MRCFIVTLACLTALLLRGQDQHRVDSLLKVYQAGAADSSRVKALNGLFTEYRYSNDSLTNKYLAEAIRLGGESGFARGYGQALYNKAVLEGERGAFDSSNVYISRSGAQYRKISDLRGLSACEMAYGFNLYDKSEFSAALGHFLKAASLKEQIKDRKGLSAADIWIGNVYNNGLGRPHDALPYFMKALQIQQEMNDESGMSYTYNNLGAAYYFLKQYPEALQNHLKSLELKEKLGNKKGLASSYDNIGNIYFDQGDYEKPIPYYQKALAIRQEFGDKVGVASSYVNIGNVYYKKKEYTRAIEMHTMALEAAKAIDFKEAMKEAANSLAACYEATGDFSKALGFYRYSASVKDSILNTTFTRQIAEMQTKFEVEKKDLEIARHKADLELKEKQGYIKNIIIGSVLALLVLLAVLGYLFFRKKQVEQKAAMAAEIASQKEARTRAVIEAEEKERRRIAQDLHDGVGQLLSAAKLNLSSLESKLKLQDPGQKDTMKNALALVDDSVKEVRMVSHNMMPNTLIKLGLASAVREFITKIGNIPSLKIDLEIVGLDNRLEPQTETVLYRVIQEVVNNIIRHAKANQISMQLIRHETEISLMIEDNGVGFDTGKIDLFEGIGLKGILSRVEFLNGSVHFDSTPGRGTTVIIEVPVA